MKMTGTEVQQSVHIPKFLDKVFVYVMYRSAQNRNSTRIELVAAVAPTSSFNLQLAHVQSLIDQSAYLDSPYFFALTTGSEPSWYY